MQPRARSLEENVRPFRNAGRLSQIALLEVHATRRRLAEGRQKKPAGIFAPALVLAAILIGQAGLAYAADLNLIRVEIDKKEQFAYLIEQHMDIAYIEPGKFVEIVAGDDEIQDLASKGFQIVTVVRDLSSHYAERAAADFGGFKTYSEIVTYINGVHSDHPSITTIPYSVGTSIEGRDLWVMKLSDNPDVDEDEPEVFYNGLHHAREPVSAELLLYTIDYLTDNYGSDPEVTDILDGRELYFLPVVNPDGYVYNETTSPDGGGMWRKNRRDNGDGTYGVDPNRNYGYMWGYDNLGSSPYTSAVDYRGTGPFSEPEIQAVRDFVESREFTIIMNYHSYSNLFLYPWGYDQIYTPDNLYFKAIADSATSFNGYAPSPGWGLYVTNGASDDWDYGEQTTKDLAFGFTPEVGSSSDGFWPSPSRIVPLCQENLPVNILIAKIADNPRKLGPPLAASMIVSSPVYTDPFTVQWSHSDSYNPADFYELVEMTGKTRVNDDLESGTGHWALDGFSTSGARTHSGSTSFYSGLGDNMKVTATPIERIEVGTGDTLFVWCWYEIESNWDYAYVQVSTDGGLTFQTLEGNITTDYNPNGNNKGNGITGSSGGWVEGIFPLNDYAGQQVVAQVLYSTDQSINGEGVYVDDVRPVVSFAGSSVLSSSIAETYYDVHGRSPGVYYYKVRAVDAEGQWGSWSDRATVEVNEASAPALSTFFLAFASTALCVLAIFGVRRRALERARGRLPGSYGS